MPSIPRSFPVFPIFVIAVALAAVAAFFIWGPKRPADPLGLAVLMAMDYAEQLEQRGIEATIVECAPIRGNVNLRETYACSFKIAGELRRIDCNINPDGGCYPVD
jgi:hypothetical protein